MMKYIVSIIILLTLSKPFFAQKEDDKKSTQTNQSVQFGDYLVKTGFQNNSSYLVIIKDKNQIFKIVGGEGTYLNIDSVSLNKDKLLDFIFSYGWDDYFTIGTIISGADGYKMNEIGDFPDLTIYCDIDSVNSKYTYDYIVKDINGDDKFDILINVICLRDSIIQIKNCSDTLFFDEIIKKISR